MKNLINKLNKISLPISILITSIIIGGFFYASQISKQKSIEKQQNIKLQNDKILEEIKVEQIKKEYIAKRKGECYDIEQRERKNYNNVDSSFYREKNDSELEKFLREINPDGEKNGDDVCLIYYKTNEYKGMDCDKVEGSYYKDQCLTGTYYKEF